MPSTLAGCRRSRRRPSRHGRTRSRPTSPGAVLQPVSPTPAHRCTAASAPRRRRRDAAVAADRRPGRHLRRPPVVTYFFASSGGHTENVENAWPGATPDPWLRGVPDPYDGAGGDPYHHWTRQMSLAAAAKDLGKLVKGELVGIKVTKTRCLAPDHDRERDRDRRHRLGHAAASSRARFGLLSTWAAFTTISSAASPTPAAAPRIVTNNLAILSQMESAFGQIDNASQTLSGKVVPAGKGAARDASGPRRRSWREAPSSSSAAAVRIRLRAALAGVYRVAYRGLDGPSVVAHSQAVGEVGEQVTARGARASERRTCSRHSRVSACPAPGPRCTGTQGGQVPTRRAVVARDGR